MPIPGKKQNVVQESFGGGTVEAEKEEREVLTETFKEERNAREGQECSECPVVGRGMQKDAVTGGWDWSQTDTKTVIPLKHVEV